MHDIAKTVTILSPIGLEAVALARGRAPTFPHIGGTAAIESVMQQVEPFADRRILEVGCSLGSTAEYIRTHGWGQVTSIDANADNIAYARSLYPQGNYVCCKAAAAPQMLEADFELIYNINTFHSLDDPAAALQGLSQVAAPGGLLRIFDFVDRGTYAQNPIIEAQTPLLAKPLPLQGIEQLLEDNGWSYHCTRPLHQQFRIWQEEFVQQVIDHKTSLLKLFKAAALEPEPSYSHLLDVARETYKSIAEGRLGGAIIMATRKKS